MNPTRVMGEGRCKRRPTVIRPALALGIGLSRVWLSRRPMLTSSLCALERSTAYLTRHDRPLVEHISPALPSYQSGHSIVSISKKEKKKNAASSITHASHSSLKSRIERRGSNRFRTLSNMTVQFDFLELGPVCAGCRYPSDCFPKCGPVQDTNRKH